MRSVVGKVVLLKMEQTPAIITRLAQFADIEPSPHGNEPYFGDFFAEVLADATANEVQELFQFLEGRTYAIVATHYSYILENWGDRSTYARRKPQSHEARSREATVGNIAKKLTGGDKGYFRQPQQDAPSFTTAKRD